MFSMFPLFQPAPKLLKLFYSRELFLKLSSAIFPSSTSGSMQKVSAMAKNKGKKRRKKMLLKEFCNCCFEREKKQLKGQKRGRALWKRKC